MFSSEKSIGIIFKSWYCTKTKQYLIELSTGNRIVDTKNGLLFFNYKTFLIFATTSAIALLSACGGSSNEPTAPSIPQPPSVNQAPTASAGDDVSAMEKSTVNLIGAGSDSDGNIATYAWTQVSNGAETVTIQNLDQASASFVLPDLSQDRDFEFELVVTDNDGATASDRVLVDAKAYLSLVSQTADTGEGIAGLSSLSFTFNKPLNESSLAPNVVVLENEEDIEYSLTASNNELIVDVLGDFRFCKNYQIDFTNVVANDGVGFEDSTQLNFSAKSRANDIFVGGVIIDGVINALYEDKWTPQYLFSSLQNNGIVNFRLGNTTNVNSRLETLPPEQWAPTWENSYWSSREFNAFILENAPSTSTNNAIFLFLSGGATHAPTYDTQNEWDSLNKAALLDAIELHAEETAQYFEDKNITVHQYEIGNEVDFGIAGYAFGKKGVPSDIDIENENSLERIKNELWVHHVDVFKAGIRGIKKANPDAKIVVHLAAMAYTTNNRYPLNFYKHMIEQGVAFDVIGLSYPYLISGNDPSIPRPYFKSNEFKLFLQSLSELGKDIQISEFSYNYDGDGVSNTPADEYPVTPEGQASFIQDFLKELSTYPKVTGAYYFYPDYYKGMNDYEFSSLGLFATPSMEQPALSVFLDPACN
jgi:hypothetical protein